MAIFPVVETASKKLIHRAATQAAANAFAAADSENRQAAVGDKSDRPRAQLADASGSWYFYDGGAPDNEAFYAYPPPTTASTRAERRSEIYAELQVRSREPVPIFAKDTEDLNMLHALTVKIYAAAQVDANMDSAAIFAHILSTAKYGYGSHLKTWAGAGTQRASWRAYLLPSEPTDPKFDQFATPDGAGQPVLQSTVGLPNGWQNLHPEVILYD